MTADFIQAAAELDVFVTKFRAVLAVTDELRRLGGIVQAGNEAQTRLDDLKRTHARAIDSHQAAITEAQNTLAGLKSQIEQHNADLEARRITANAEIEAKNVEHVRLEQDARASAEAIIGDARAQGAQVIERAKAEAAQIAAVTAAKQRELGDLQATIAETKALQDELCLHIDILKAKFA